MYMYIIMCRETERQRDRETERERGREGERERKTDRWRHINTKLTVFLVSVLETGNNCMTKENKMYMYIH